MKYILIINLLIANLISSYAKTDTVYVCHNRTTNIIVPEQITAVEVGSTGFITNVQKNSLLIKPDLNTKTGKATSIYLQFKSQEKQYDYYTALVLCSNDQSKPFSYDLRENFISEAERLKNKEEEELRIKLERVKKKVDLLQSKPIEIRDIGEYKENIVMLLRSIGMDDKNLYLCFEVKNKSSIDFNINTIDLSYVKKIEKGIFKKSEFQREPVSMQWGNKPSRNITGGGQAVISFAMPIYGIKTNDYLQVMFREKGGNRNLEFKVYGKDISKYAKYILLEEEQYVNMHP